MSATFDETKVRRDRGGRFRVKEHCESDGGTSSLSGVDDNAPQQFYDLYDRQQFDADAYRSRCEEFLSERTPDELEALHRYVHSEYQEINEALYGNAPLTGDLSEVVKNLDAALERAPDAPPLLWRSLGGKTLAERFLAKGYQIGDFIETYGFSSTAETPDAMSGFLSNKDYYISEVEPENWEKDPGRPFLVKPTDDYTTGPARNVALMMKASTAAPVSTLRGSMVLEQEWLVPRNRKFRVMAIHRNVNLEQLHYGCEGIRAQVYELEEFWRS